MLAAIRGNVEGRKACRATGLAAADDSNVEAGRRSRDMLIGDRSERVTCVGGIEVVELQVPSPSSGEKMSREAGSCWAALNLFRQDDKLLSLQ